jgi:opacity protein-like surface antigen
MSAVRISVALATVLLSPTRVPAGPGLSFELEPAGAGVDLVPALGAASLRAPPDSEGAAPPPAADPWHLSVIPTFWAPIGFDGTVEVGPIATEIDLGASDIYDNLDSAIEGGMALSNDDWSFLLYGSYFKLGGDVRSRLSLGLEGDTSLEYELTIVDFAVGKRIARGSIGSAAWKADLLGGLRYSQHEFEISQTDPLGFDPMIDLSQDWVDAFVGGRLTLDFNEAVRLWFRGDVGGFSIGSSADLTWTLTAMLELRLSDRWLLVAGYRYLDVEWDRGSGPSRIEYDYALHGPMIGASVRF